MSIHDLALEWVASKTGGEITHHRSELWAKGTFGGKIPDVVVDNNDIHEIEVFKILKKVEGYEAIKGKKTLWIVLDVNPYIAFDVVKTLCYDHNKGFKHIEIDGIENQIEAIHHERIVEMRQKFVKLQETVSKLKKENEALKHKILELLNEKRSLESQIKTLKRTLTSLKEERANLKKEIEKVKNSLNFYIDFQEGNSLISLKLPTETALQFLREKGIEIS